MTDRHEKWVRVEPGTVIPAGQPHAIKAGNNPSGYGLLWGEYCFREPVPVPNNEDDWFVDSSWRPPLELPTEPTWGIAIISGDILRLGEWSIFSGKFYSEQWGGFTLESITGFIPLTDEQVERIEAVR